MPTKLAISLLVVSLVEILIVGSVGAGWGWEDPAIEGTPLHVWGPAGAEFEIQTNVLPHDWVLYHVAVTYPCDEGTFEAGINQSVLAPGDWLYFDQAACGHTVRFHGLWSGS
ncbi:MAG: hypothetical protein AB1791_16305 [Chloroflexota bacterium]